MSPKLPRITAGEMLGVLKRRGFVTVRVSGSHYILRDKMKRRTNVPFHSKEILRLGTLNSILEDAGMTIQELINEL